jgi:phospholipid/cholesterol/gamma-HCH transport system permease protein
VSASAGRPPGGGWKVEETPSGRRLRLTGPLEEVDLRAILPMIPGEGPIVLDLAGVGTITGRGARRLLDLAAALEARGQEPLLRAGSEERRRLLSLYARRFPEPPGRSLPPALDRLALRVSAWIAAFWTGTLLVMRTGATVLRQVLGLERRRGDAVLRGIVRMGIHALPLVGLISSLIGIILALQAAPLMRQWGQELRIADLVGLSVTKEIGPLLVAILVAGRSGAALAAEIATMRVSEEIDALEVMGVSPLGYLVAPRLRALAIVLPALTLFADLLGVLGGYGVGVLLLDLSPQAYLSQTIEAVEARFVVHGLLKSSCFGIAIALVAAHQGFRARGGAAAVGQSTTRAVVQSVLWIILVDAVFTSVQARMDW